MTIKIKAKPVDSTNVASTPDNNSQEFNPYKYAAVYARQSSKSDSFSIPSQVADCKKYLSDNHLLLYNVYEDKESGRQDLETRKSFVKLLNDMYAGMFKTLIVIRMDRLSRRIDDFMKIKNIFKAHDVNVIYVKEPQLNFEEESYMANFIQNMVMAVSTFEPDNIADRTSFGKAQARKQGKYKFGKSIPYGFVKDDTTKKLMIDPSRSHVVKKVFGDYLKFKTGDKSIKLKDIVDYVQTSENEREMRKITSSFIYDLIQRPTYAGLMLLDPTIELRSMIYYDEVEKQYAFIEDNFVECTNIEGKIIEEEYWKKVVIKHFEDTLDEPLEAKAYLFKNLLYCQTCKSPIKNIEEDYVCNDRCINTTQDTLITAIIGQILRDTNNTNIVEIIKDEIARTKDSIKNKKLALRDYTLKIRKSLYTNIIDQSPSPISKSAYFEEVAKRNQLKTEIEDLGNQLRQHENKIESINLFKFQMANFNNQEDLHFIKNNWKFSHELLSKIMVKAVLKKNSNDGYQVKIKYIN